MQSTFLPKAPVISKPPKPTASENAVFSIIIPSWNNLEFLKTCIASLRKNSPSKNGSHMFLHKLGISLNTFTKHYLRRVQDWTGPLEMPSKTFKLSVSRGLNEMKQKII